MDPCCCDRPCIIFADDFNRSDSTNLGSELIEAVGDSDIFTDTLRIPAGGIVLGTKKHPINPPTGVVSVDLHGLAHPEIRRVLINSTINASSYLYAEIETTSSSAATLRVGSSGGGTLHELTGLFYPAPGSEGSPRLQVCRTLTGISATFEDDPGLVWDCVEWGGGRYAGMMNAGVAPVQFDNYKFNESSYTLPTKGCGTCVCECGEIPPTGVGTCVPKIMKLVFIASGSCDCLHGRCINLSYDQTNPSIISWTGSAELCDWTGTGTNIWEFKLVCGPTWQLCVKNIESTVCDVNPGGWGSGGTNCWNGFDSEAVNALSFTCDPTEIIFPGFTCSGTPPDPPECNYTVVVLDGAC